MINGSQQKWLPKREVLSRYRVPTRQLDRAVTEGIIQTVKFGEKAQSARLFRTADIEAWLNSLSTGRTPRKPRGRQ